MDDAAIFEAFLTNIGGINAARARNKLLQFAPSFRGLLSTSEKELNNFVKSTHAANSARADNRKILIPTAAVIALKAVLF